MLSTTKRLPLIETLRGSVSRRPFSTAMKNGKTSFPLAADLRERKTIDCFEIRVELNDLIHLSEMMSLRFIAFHPIDRLDLPALRVKIL